MKSISILAGTIMLLLALAACGGGNENREVKTAPLPADSAGREPETALIEGEDGVGAVAAQEVKQEAAGKPKLIEFYADW